MEKTNSESKAGGEGVPELSDSSTRDSSSVSIVIGQNLQHHQINSMIIETILNAASTIRPVSISFA